MLNLVNARIIPFYNTENVKPQGKKVNFGAISYETINKIAYGSENTANAINNFSTYFSLFLNGVKVCLSGKLSILKCSLQEKVSTKKNLNYCTWNLPSTMINDVSLITTPRNNDTVEFMLHGKNHKLTLKPDNDSLILDIATSAKSSPLHTNQELKGIVELEDFKKEPAGISFNSNATGDEKKLFEILKTVYDTALKIKNNSPI